MAKAVVVVIFLFVKILMTSFLVPLVLRQSGNLLASKVKTPRIIMLIINNTLVVPGLPRIATRTLRGCHD